MSGPNLPIIITEPWAAGGVFNVVPVPSQIAVTPGRASWTDGFPPVTRIPVAAGGTPPYGEDMNGALNQLSYTAQYQQALSGYPYSAALSTALGGYPLGAIVQTSDTNGFWENTVNGNTNAPETNATGWSPLGQERPRSVAVTGVAQTLSILQSGSDTIILTGVLTGNTVITLTPFSGPWTFVNNTTGNFTLTAKVPAGTTALLTAGATVVQCDGTNISALSAQQVGAALAATHAVQFGQVSGVPGASRNLFMNNQTAGTSAVFTADAIDVETALGGLHYLIPSLNVTLNISTTGANGMDTGSAPASSFLGVYGIYNPTTKTAAVLGVSANAVTLPEIYGGANMPAGYTASALLCVVPTTASNQINQCVVRDRRTEILTTAMFSTSTTTSAGTAVIANNLAVPLNAKRCSGFMQISNTGASSTNMSLSASATPLGQKLLAASLNASSIATPFENLAITTGQRVFYGATSSAGTPTFSASCGSYEI